MKDISESNVIRYKERSWCLVLNSSEDRYVDEECLPTRYVDCLLKLLDSVRAVDLTVFSDAREWCWASLFEGRVIDARVLVI